VVAPLRGELLPAALLARATTAGANFVLAGHLSGEGEDAVLQVKLFGASESQFVWSESFPVRGADDTSVAERIATQVLDKVPRKEPRRPKGP
jgi:TolB-like protein